MTLKLPRSRKVRRKQKALEQRRTPWRVCGQLWLDILLFFLSSTGIATHGHPWEVKVHSIRVKIRAKHLRTCKTRKESYPSIK